MIPISQIITGDEFAWRDKSFVNLVHLLSRLGYELLCVKALRPLKQVTSAASRIKVNSASRTHPGVTSYCVAVAVSVAISVSVSVAVSVSVPMAMRRASNVTCVVVFVTVTEVNISPSCNVYGSEIPA